MKVNIVYDLDGDEFSKSEVHIDPQDTWSMDCTLADVIIPMLIQLRDTTHGYPAEFANEDEENDGGFEAWKDIINKMIWSFGEASKGYPTDSYFSADEKFLKAEYEEYHKKLQEGFDLFGKYYMALWD